MKRETLSSNRFIFFLILYLAVYNDSYSQIDHGYLDLPHGFADVNGDGYTDYITFRGQHEKPEIFVYFSDGHSIKEQPTRNNKIMIWAMLICQGDLRM